RMPTVSALRRRGFPPDGVRNFLDVVGVGGKGKSAVEIEALEHEVRDVLNGTAPRRFAVLRPLRLVIENFPEGQVEELQAVNTPDGRRPKATLHWLSAEHAVPAEVRLYDRLFTRPDPGADGDPFADINPNSETVLAECLVEPALAELPVGETVQFERLGYFCPDPDSTPGQLVFNRTL